MKIITVTGEIDIDEEVLITIPYFKALRDSGMVDSKENECTLEDIDVEIINLYLEAKKNNYSIECLSYRTVCAIGLVAIRLGDKELPNVIETYLRKNLNSHTIVFAIQYASEVPTFLPICFNFIDNDKNWTDLSSIIADFPYELMMMMLASKNIYTAVKLPYLIRWYISHPENKKMVDKFLKTFEWKDVSFHKIQILRLMKQLARDCLLVPDKIIATSISECLIEKMIYHEYDVSLHNSKNICIEQLHNTNAAFGIGIDRVYLYHSRVKVIISIPNVQATVDSDTLIFPIGDHILKIINMLAEFVKVNRVELDLDQDYTFELPITDNKLACSYYKTAFISTLTLEPPINTVSSFRNVMILFAGEKFDSHTFLLTADVIVATIEERSFI